MSDPGPTPNKELLANALRALERARGRIDELEAERSEPIAVVGIGCRLPGAVEGPDVLWDRLREAADLTSDVPADRWDADAYHDDDPATPGKMVMRRGGFIEDLFGFEPELFSISPREAPHIDPQQRLLLQVAWEALEHAAIAPTSLKGTATGVWMGISTSEYQSWLLENLPRDQILGPQGTGIAHSAASGRISYALGLKGPSMAINTACSSSLVALHLACESLRRRESSAAIVGGVNALLHPLCSMVFSQARMLSPDGRCKTFCADADGYARAEGAAAVVLKRRSDAVRDGDRILAEIIGSAVNQDGPSSGLTVPNGPMQVAAIRDALKSADVDPGMVDLIEAHGTGTALGDPLELGALRDVFSGPRTSPVFVSSIKANCGHLEAAAGIGGFLRLVLQIWHGEVVPHLLHGERTPHVDWSDAPFALPSEVTSWEGHGGVRIGGVSSFGFTGTNVHVVCRSAAPVHGKDGAARSGAVPVLLSARTDESLDALVSRWMAMLSGPGDRSIHAVAATASRGRAPMRCRLAIVADSLDDLLRQLADDPRPARAEVHGRVKRRASFVIGKPPTSWRDLAAMLGDEPAFVEAFDAWGAGLPDRDALIEPRSDGPLENAAAHGVVFALVRWLTAAGLECVSASGRGEAAAVAACLNGDLDPAEAAAGLLDPASTLPVDVRAAEAVPSQLVVGIGAPVAARDGRPALALNGAGAGDVALSRLIADAWLLGCNVCVPSAGCSVVDLPTYPFACETFLVHPNPGTRFPVDVPGHPLLGAPVETADGVTYEVRLAPAAPKWVATARASTATACFLEALRAAAVHDLGTERVVLSDVVILPVPLDAGARLRVTVEGGRISLEACVDGKAWEFGASAFMRRGEPLELRRCDDAWEFGVHLGAEFDFDSRAYGLHPVLGAHLWPDEGEFTTVIDAVAFDGRAGARVDVESADGDLRVFGEAGAFASFSSLEVTPGRASRRGHLLIYGASSSLHEAPGQPACDAVEPAAVLDLSGPNIADLATALVDLAAFAAERRDPYSLVVTRGAWNPVSPSSHRARALWGGLRALRQEYPGHDIRIVDVGEADPIPDAVAGDETILRAGKRLEQSWESVPGSRWLPPVSGVWIVTGGTGGVGSAIARGLLDHGADRVVLASRSAGPDAQAGSGIERFACDVTRLEDVLRLVKGARDHGTVTGIIHAAGVIDDVLSVNLTADRARRVLAPKIDGARHIVEALERDEALRKSLEHVVFLSSSSAWLGNAGQVHYAAANAGMEALVERVVGPDVTARSVTFGPWEETGMTVGMDAGVWSAAGIRPLSPRDAVDALLSILGAEERAIHPVVIDIDWARLRLPWVPPGIRRLVRGSSAGDRRHDPEDQGVLEGVSAEERPAVVNDVLISELGAVLRIDATNIDASASLLEAGLDSLLAMELGHRVRARLGVALPAASLVEGASLDDVRALVMSSLESGATVADVADADLDELLDEIEGLSEDDLRRELGDDLES